MRRPLSPAQLDYAADDVRHLDALYRASAGKLHELGREAWLSISRDFPTELPDALEQVGVCYHLDKNYRAALENYEAAIRLGANADHLADNIAEARKGLAAVG